MKQFARLVHILGTSTKTNAKISALQQYFNSAPPADKTWVIALFTGKRPRRTVSGALLALWCMEITGLPSWLFEESYHTVGDFAETISLLLPESEKADSSNIPLSYYMKGLIELEREDEATRKKFVTESWDKMDQTEMFVFNKLITGGFRIGVSQKTIVNAIAANTGVSPSVIAHRISGKWDPSTTSYDELLSEEHTVADVSKPYPFYLSYALEGEASSLGNVEDWQAEWKWDGIRGQIIKRNNELFTWSRGEELITDKFPEYLPLAPLLPNGTVLDGEIIGLANSPDGITPLPFSALQTRIGRKNITRKNLVEVPVAFIAYDLLELNGDDLRETPFSERRDLLKKIIEEAKHAALQLSPGITFNTWDELTEIRKLSREKGSEGIMLKRKDSVYKVGRKRGDWWKWKIDPLTIDAVMIYAQKGAGRRSNLYTDYTFAVKDGDKLVPFAKAYSGLTDKEFAKVDSFVKRNSLEKFGPVRTVKPELVFEIAFEGISESKRHKSGVALRFPRMSRWRQDKKPDEINTLDDLKQILETYNSQYSPSRNEEAENQ